MAGGNRSNDKNFILKVTKELGRAGKGKGLRKFADYLFSGAHDGDYVELSPQAGAHLAMTGWKLLSKRAPGKHNIRISNPEAGKGLGNITVIEILNEDMPFLVDSVMGEIQERGLRVIRVVHPVLRIARDKKHNLTNVAGQSGAPPDDVVKESYIQVHVARISDKDLLSDMEASLAGILKDVTTVVADWRAMLTQLDSAVAAYSTAPSTVKAGDLAESIQFLKWLLDNNFTFLGMRSYSFIGG